MALKNNPAEKGDVVGAPADAASPAAVVFARRAMWRAGRHWQAGRNELTADQLAEIGEAKMKAVLADPNFSTAATIGAAAVALDPQGRPIDAHTVVTARRAMWRGGVRWNAGANPLTADQVEALGDKLELVRADTGNFAVALGAPAEPAAA
jgi:hypothetical protein